jgi:hypothetical protein
MSELNFSIDSREIRDYFRMLSGHLIKTVVTSSSRKTLELADAVNQIMALALATHAAGNKLIFIGNGGSAAIASHMATDYSKNGHIRAFALNDGSMLTCLGNDFGYDQVFCQTNRTIRPTRRSPDCHQQFGSFCKYSQCGQGRSKWQMQHHNDEWIYVR